mgnify:CR=1 FL=1
MTRKQHFNYYIAACDKEGGIYRCSLQNGILKVEDFTPIDRPMYMVEGGGKMYVLLRDPMGDGISGLQSFSLAEDGSRRIVCPFIQSRLCFCAQNPLVDPGRQWHNPGNRYDDRKEDCKAASGRCSDEN